jgi:hypothetical protein
LFGIAYSDSSKTFVAVGGSNDETYYLADDAELILSSSDGISWEPGDWTPVTGGKVGCGGGTPPHANNGLHAVTWADNEFVAIGTLMDGLVGFTSPTGAQSSWQESDVSDSACQAGDLPGDYWALTWSGSEFLTIGEDSYSNDYAVTSPDGVGSDWLSTGLAKSGISSTTFTGVAWTGKLFVAVGYGGAVVLSNDGKSWQSQNSGTTSDLYAVAWSGSELVAVGKGGVTLTSPDGITWTQENSGTTNDINAVMWSGNNFVAVGYQGMVLTSQ